MILRMSSALAVRLEMRAFSILKSALMIWSSSVLPISAHRASAQGECDSLMARSRHSRRVRPATGSDSCQVPDESRR